MRATIHALAALVLLTATHAYAQDSTKLAGSKDATVTVDLARHRVEIESRGAGAQALSDAIEDAGYTPVPV